ncbi:3-keto-L-gulonate-6-phosphate decarboxylase UlaD [Vibrio sp. S9_S30]|uniref:3-keto-L-gulonate-6-phosphate decarboxylase UlaD n=1 Tax=Vibrio sp. S9_S30 TaxID=2720226 RepID=UPI001680EED5|nr:3-keto-L-gulonate-6-phosphate decarboxylase UlaD [Vibrio sp. S9_S30]MBD1558817.1 3-keto-L-gulonate-6-phosphate decarboxylase UlaD [Vibrio sp. S9_S30]
MTRPMIQIALDSPHLETAVETASHVAAYVDIIEVGTILAFSEGMPAVRLLRHRHPNHLLVCDMKITDGGAILAKMAFEAGADWVTVSAAAHMATIEACHKIAQEYGKEIQIELYGNWTLYDVQDWIDLGIKQAIYHRPRDAELAGVGWRNRDIDRMRSLSEMGLELSITGGIVPDDIQIFRGINTKCFIAGRALANENGKNTADAIRVQISKHWGSSQKTNRLS